MTLLAYALLVGLGAYRLYRIGARDEITHRPRTWLYDRQGKVWEWVCDLVDCPWCIGFWWSGVLAGLVTWYVGYEWPVFVLLWLAGSTVCGLLKRLDP